MKMKKWQATVLVCASLVCLSACNNQMESQADKQNGDKQAQVSSQVAKNGEAVTDFELTGVDGKTYHLSDYKGKKVYLKFWASWCSICLASLPDTDDLAKEESDDYVILTVVSPGQKEAQATPIPLKSRRQQLVKVKKSRKKLSQVKMRTYMKSI